MVVHKTQVLPLSSDVPVSAAVTKKPLSVFPKPSFAAGVLLLLPFFLLAFIYLFLFPQEFQLQSFIASCNPIAASSYVGSSDALTTRVTREPDFRLLIGVLTRADLYERRHLLRLVYALQMANLTAHVDVRYVFCRLYKDDQRILVPLEIMQHDDIIILDCEENLNDGKTYTYFSSIAKLYGGGSGAEGGRRPPYDYVMKADDDLFVRLLTLIESLRPMPRDDMYYGAVIPCDSMDPFRDYMSGMGYILSWDLVEWIGSSEAVRNKSAGVEDMLTGEWLRTAGKGKNRFNAKPAMYDFPIPVPIDACSHGFVPDTVAVHRLKDNPKWATTLKYFNFTQGLKPSKFYRID
ncbi:beta-1,3-galactosyltransferase pvg3-like [Ananas comosus]|uniref:Hexosyltransferase n=1 Tax=Ananas comosus TaxID=4615 RepID=A0A6P5EQ75_ANACO|nr:beta-1,3-galactosyltransferase pvg3-like [Ananas comosus]